MQHNDADNDNNNSHNKVRACADTAYRMKMSELQAVQCSNNETQKSH